MLPEQRGLLMSWFSRLRRSSARRSAPPCRRNIRPWSAHLEPLEERRMLVANLYVDFGDLLPTLTQNVGQWATYGLTVPRNQASWIQGPDFPFANNVAVTYESFRTVMSRPQYRPILDAFDPGPSPAGDPFEFEVGPEPPIDKISAIETSIIEE